MKISIVTAYHNRKQQFINTLKTIKNSKQINNVELIVVDDCSSEEHKLDDIIHEYPFVKLITVNVSDRWYINPCVPFNKAINEANGDIIVIQNPECLHVGDILDNIVNNINDNLYLTYGVYSINKEITNYITDLPYDNEYIDKMILAQISPIHNAMYVSEGQFGWYQHSKYRPAAYHFVSAITKKNMDLLNGFDEKYAFGIGFDDDELLHRIKLLGLEVKMVDEPFAIHQWHYHENNFFAKADNIGLAIERNKNLFNNTKQTTTWHVN